MSQRDGGHCKYCGAKLRLDFVGHYCPTKNCERARFDEALRCWREAIRQQS